MLTIRRLGGFMLLGMAAVFSGYAFAQNTTTGGSDQSSATNAASTSGNSTTTTPSQTNQTSPDSANVTPLTPGQLAAGQQQQQQLTLQFMQQLQGASPDDQVAIIADYRQELDSLSASVAPPPLTTAQLTQLNAQQQLVPQTYLQLPAAAQLAASGLQQRQQLASQLATATADQKVAIIAQIQQLVAQQDQVTAAQTAAASNNAGSGAATPAQASTVAPLSTNQQAMMQALIQRGQAIQAALLLSPDEQAAALQAIQAQPLPAPTLTSNAASTSDVTSSSTLSAPSQP